MKIKLILLLALMLVGRTLAADDQAGSPAPAAATTSNEAKYTAVLEARVNDILKVLALADTNQAARVHDILVQQYRSLNAWHDTNDAKLKEARNDAAASASIKASLKALHDAFLGKLAENLTADQIEKVKDKMTYGKVQFTYTGYCNQYPNLSEANKQEILRLLKAAREEAIDGGSAKEKTAIFLRYKGKINNYLSKQGVMPDKAKSSAQ